MSRGASYQNAARCAHSPEPPSNKDSLGANSAPSQIRSVAFDGPPAAGVQVAVYCCAALRGDYAEDWRTELVQRLAAEAGGPAGPSAQEPSPFFLVWLFHDDCDLSRQPTLHTAQQRASQSGIGLWVKRHPSKYSPLFLTSRCHPSS